MTEAAATEQKNEWAKLRPSSVIMPILCLILLLSICPVLSFNTDEVHCLAGGLEETPLIHNNIFGRLGTAIAWRFLLTFGIAGYPLILLMLLSSLRRVLWRCNLKAISWEYILSFLLFGIGLSTFFGIWPDAFKGFTAELNLSTLPGGVIGQRLSSPAGFLTLFMNNTGAAILSIAAIALPIAIIWYFDWQDIFKALPASQARKTAEESALPHQEVFDAKPNEPAPEPKIIQAEPQPQLSVTTFDQPHQPSSPRPIDKYEYPSVTLLDDRSACEHNGANAREIERNAKLLQKTLDDFNIAARVVSQVTAPQVTQFEIMPEAGVRLNAITGLESNIKMSLAAESLRILAPIPGKNLVGVQVPNEHRAVVSVRSLMQDENWKSDKNQIPLLLGKSINGRNIILDLAKAPHLLIAGTTGSGKSVCMNLLITSMLFKFNPEELRLIMVDPKVVEFQAYTTLPHLVVPVINEVEKVPLALKWAINEMERRYRVLAKVGVRNLADFNSRKIAKNEEPLLDDEGNPIPDKLPFIVVIIDELADIMAVAKKEVEQNLARIAAKSRAVGIHTIIATQRPDTKVITGTIKANYPVRIAFRVASHIDSMTILNCKGAESLLGYGDMLFQPPGASNIERIQCGMASDEERNKVVAFCASQAPQNFDESVFVSPDDAPENPDSDADDDLGDAGRGAASGEELLIKKAIDAILQSRRPTISYIQRALGIGYNKAASIMEELEARGIVGPQISPSVPRQILVTSSAKQNGNGDNQE